LTAIPGGAISLQPPRAANSASGAPGVLAQSSSANTGAEPQKALWTKVFDFYQHASVDAGSMLAAEPTINVASAQNLSAQMTATQTAATKIALAASEALPMTQPPALPPLLEPSAATGRAKLVSIRAGVAEAQGKTSSMARNAARKETSAAQKSLSSLVPASVMPVAVAVPPSPVVPSSVVPSLVPSSAVLPGMGLAAGAKADGLPGEGAVGASAASVGLAGGREAASATQLQAPRLQGMQFGFMESGSILPGTTSGSIQSGTIQSGAQVGKTGKLPAITAQTTNSGAELTAKPEVKLVPPIPPTDAAMRWSELASGLKPLPAAATQAAVSGDSQAIADVASKPVSSTLVAAAQSDLTRPGMTSSSVTSSSPASASPAQSLDGPAAQGPASASSPASAAVSASGSAHSSSSDASTGSKSGTAMHGATQTLGGAPGTWAAAVVGHPGESAAVVTGAPVTGATSGATSGAASVAATLASGHTAPALHPGQVFESLDAAPGAWNPGQTARTVSGGASLSVGYQDARLGYVELQARQVAGGVQATLVPSSEAARQALEGQLGSLGGWLAQRATPVDRLAVGMPSSMAAMTTDHGGAMNPGGAMNSGGAMDQGRTPNQSLMQSMAQAAQQGLAGGGSRRGESADESANGSGQGLSAVGAVGLRGRVAGVDSGSLVPDRNAALDRGSAESAMQNEMRVEAARIGLGQTISVRA
jgi:hypothetical protein